MDNPLLWLLIYAVGIFVCMIGWPIVDKDFNIESADNIAMVAVFSMGWPLIALVVVLVVLVQTPMRLGVMIRTWSRG